MAEQNFFDLLKHKMAAMQPSENHLDDDWAALGGRLDAALPQTPRKQRRVIVLPLILLAALLSTNAVWWQSTRNDQAKLLRLETQVVDLQRLAAATPSLVTPVVRIDTVWKTVYVRSALRNLELDVVSASQQQAAVASGANQSFEAALQPTAPLATIASAAEINDAKSLKTPSTTAAVTPDAMPSLGHLSPLEPTQIALFDIPKAELLLTKCLVAQQAGEIKPTKPFTKKVSDVLRPNFFKIGASAGWLYAVSSGLMHEGGYTCQLRGEVGLTRHWSVTGAWSKGQLHYKAHDLAAILGAPALPILPSSDHHFAGMDVTGQRIRQFEVGLRYTFLQPSQPRPFLGLGCGQQMLAPFKVEYEIQHEPTGTLQKELFEVTTQTRLRNVIGLNTGLTLPLSTRFDLALEGYYQRAWKKSSKSAPDLAGIRAGVHWLF
jgi:hypothetical protein